MFTIGTKKMTWRRSRQLLFVITVLAAHTALCSSVIGGGLSTPLGEVVIENLQIGQAYNLTELAGIGLSVTNSGELSVDLQIDVLLPHEQELKHEAECIPDISWVSVAQDYFKLATGATATTDIKISVPDDPRYLGKKYQVSIWSHTIPGETGGMYLAFGLKSRVIFTIDSVISTDVVAGETLGTGCRLEVKPERISVSNLVIGEKTDLSEHSGNTLTVTNTGTEVAMCKLVGKKVSTSLVKLEDGYEDLPEGVELSFSNEQFELQPGQSKDIRMFLEIPSDCDCHGGYYMIVIYASAEGTGVVTGVYSRLFVSVQ